MSGYVLYRLKKSKNIHEIAKIKILAIALTHERAEKLKLQFEKELETKPNPNSFMGNMYFWEIKVSPEISIY